MGIIENCLIFKKAWGSRAHDKTMIKFVSETKICRNRYHVIRVLWLWHLYLRTAISPEFWLHGSGNTHRKHKCHLAPKDFSVHEMRLQQFIRSFMQCVCVCCVCGVCACVMCMFLYRCACVCACACECQSTILNTIAWKPFSSSWWQELFLTQSLSIRLDWLARENQQSIAFHLPVSGNNAHATVPGFWCQFGGYN